MKIAIQAIFFNGEKHLPPNMLLAWLDQADKLADFVFITEGATKAVNHYWDGDTSSFTNDGKSTDNTISIIKKYIKHKPKFFLKEADGFWDGKTQMLNYWFYEDSPIYEADYVWQVDADEFYTEENAFKILSILESELPSRVDFFANHFWGDFNHCIDERSDGVWANEIPWRRIFKINKKSEWISHEPPDMHFNEYKKIITKYQTLEKGIKLEHYSYVSEDQVIFKSKFYNNPDKLKLFNDWKLNNKIYIFGCRVFPFYGEYPEIINKYYKHIKARYLV
tara:strand:+ start:182 stop:1018 length:837 start_codon:yes stop_codon:yes gene_type:complete